MGHTVWQGNSTSDKEELLKIKTDHEAWDAVCTQLADKKETGPRSQ